MKKLTIILIAFAMVVGIVYKALRSEVVKLEMGKSRKQIERKTNHE